VEIRLAIRRSANSVWPVSWRRPASHSCVGLLGLKTPTARHRSWCRRRAESIRATPTGPGQLPPEPARLYDTSAAHCRPTSFRTSPTCSTRSPVSRSTTTAGLLAPVLGLRRGSRRIIERDRGPCPPGPRSRSSDQVQLAGRQSGLSTRSNRSSQAGGRSTLVRGICALKPRVCGSRTTSTSGRSWAGSLDTPGCSTSGSGRVLVGNADGCNRNLDRRVESAAVVGAARRWRPSPRSATRAAPGHTASGSCMPTDRWCPLRTSDSRLSPAVRDHHGGDDGACLPTVVDSDYGEDPRRSSQVFRCCLAAGPTGGVRRAPPPRLRLLVAPQGQARATTRRCARARRETARGGRSRPFVSAPLLGRVQLRHGPVPRPQRCALILLGRAGARGSSPPTTEVTSCTSWTSRMPARRLSYPHEPRRPSAVATSGVPESPPSCSCGARQSGKKPASHWDGHDDLATVILHPVIQPAAVHLESSCQPSVCRHPPG